MVSGSARIVGAGYVKLVAPPGFALGVWRELGPPTVCSRCDTFIAGPRPHACTTEEVQPAEPARVFNFQVEVRPAGPPLVSAATNPREAVLHTDLSEGREDGDVVYALPLSNTPAACAGGTLQVREGRVVSRPSGCRATVTLQAGEALRPFGTPWLENRRIDRSAVDATPRTIVLNGDVVARQRLTIPARGLVRLTGYARPADGGGHAGLCALPSCGAPCVATAEQPWVSNGPPAELELTNTTMAERTQLVAVSQLLTGYDGQRVTVREGPPRAAALSAAAAPTRYDGRWSRRAPTPGRAA